MRTVLENPFTNSVAPPSAPDAVAADAVPQRSLAAAGHFHRMVQRAREERAENHRFVLDVSAFMNAIEEPPPLFLRVVS